MTGVIDTLERAQLRTVPDFQAGDRVKVHFQVVEGTRRRTQVFEGTVIKRQGSGVRETFTVRKQSFGVGVERTFPVHSPKIERIEVASRGDVRRAKLYYLRGRVGRRARVRERQFTSPEARRAAEQSGKLFEEVSGAVDSEGVSVAEADIVPPEAEPEGTAGDATEAAAAEGEAGTEANASAGAPAEAPEGEAEAVAPADAEAPRRKRPPTPPTPPTLTPVQARRAMRPMRTPATPKRKAPDALAGTVRSTVAAVEEREVKGKEKKKKSSTNSAIEFVDHHRGRARARGRHPGLPRQAVPDPEPLDGSDPRGGPARARESPRASFRRPEPRRHRRVQAAEGR